MKRSPAFIARSNGHDTHVRRAALVALALLLVTGVDATAQILTWESIGPYGRPVSAFGADSSGALYAYSRGIRRSTDGGATWQLLSTRVMAAVAANRRALMMMDNNGQLFRSTDQAVSWDSVRPRLAGIDSVATAVAAAPDGSFYVRTLGRSPEPSRLIRSSDDGATWNLVPLEGTRGLRLHEPGRDGALIVTTDSATLRTTDAGITWSPLPEEVEGLVSMQRDASGTIVAIVGSGPRAFSGRILYRSSDEGATWTRGDSLPEFITTVPAITADGSLAVVGQQGIHSSIDGGRSWRLWRSDSGFAGAILDAVGDDLYLSVASFALATRFAGLHVSTDGGASFTLLNEGFGGLSIYSAVPIDGQRVLAITDRGGVYRGDYSGEEWTPEAYSTRRIERGPDGSLYRLDSARGVRGSNAFLRSTDNGVTWVASDTAEAGNFSELAIAPDGAFVASSTWYGVWRTADRATWSRLDSEFLEAATAIAFDSSGSMLVGTNGAGLYRYNEGLDRFQALNAGIGSARVNDIAVTPDGAILVTIAGKGIRRSTDNGATFSDVVNGLPTLVVIQLAVSPLGVVLVETDTYVYVSRDAGLNWVYAGQGLAGVIYSLAFDESGRVVVATSEGVHLSRESVASAPARRVAALDAPVVCSPNPVTSTMRVVVTMGAGRASVRVVDALARVIATLHEGMLPSGTSHLTWDARDVAAGAYRVMLETDDGVSSTPVVIVR